ncbi:hypothetical protein Mgra_00009100 [Meloidogyne graminicola]|uniref:Uncharacterized protein n=1 Tax=Meloidogyne graminicola TaxID=189291 RepID=A0A8S9ZE03_9BILA|nr:hypothetical protein Mgra_00009100 [Meloidogyne graminicola]
MGIIIFISITIWNFIFAKMGINLHNFIFNEIKIKLINLNYIEMVPLLTAEVYYGIFCMLISICSAIQGNIFMGLLAVIIFSFQIIVQYLIFYNNLINENKWKLALVFASTNGLNQASQAIAYFGGFLLVQNGFTKALSVFKIIQTMHLGSSGLTSLLLISNDFIKTTKELTFIETKKNKIISTENKDKEIT